MYGFEKEKLRFYGLFFAYLEICSLRGLNFVLYCSKIKWKKPHTA